MLTRGRGLLIASAIGMLVGAQAIAQTVGVAPGERLVIEPEQRTVIRQYVVKEKVPSVRVKERITVGEAIPSGIELHAVPSAWGPKLTRYKYVYTDDHVYLVDPDRRIVVQEID